MTYQERLNALAEKMANVEYPTRVENDRVWNSIIESFYPLAAIALQEMSEVAKETMLHFNNCNCDTCTEDKEDYIHSLGLIPEKTK